MNSTMPGASTNSTTPSIWILGDLEIAMLCINLLFSLLIHIYVIWLIIKGTGSGITSGFFNLNLSVCEIGNCLDNLVFVMSNWFSYLILLSEFLQGLGITGRPLFQCLMCVERYLAVVHPVTFLKFKPLKYRVICCTAAWIVILGSCLVCKIIFLLFTITVYAWFVLVQFLLFFFIQLFCLVAVLRALKQSGPGERRRKREEGNHMKRRAFNLILITTVNIVIVYVLFTIIGLLNILTKHNIPALWLFAVICYALANFIQPVLYLHRAGKLSYLCSP